MGDTRAASNGIDIEVSRHHTVSVSNFQSIRVSTDDWMVHCESLTKVKTAFVHSLSYLNRPNTSKIHRSDDLFINAAIMQLN